ncbi:MAG: serine/threonine-protein kinase [Myxococcota bacterium]
MPWFDSRIASSSGGPLDDENAELEWLLEATRQRLFGASSAPSMIGRYFVIQRLGAGAMGTVYEAFDRMLERRVAVKVLRRHLPSSYAERFVREAQALARVSHPNVVQVYEAAEYEGLTFIAMELVEGRTLEKWCAQDSRPGWRACVEIYLQAGAGLAAAHEQGLVHRDFKPSNIMIDARGRVCVLDFGLARAASESLLPSLDPTESKPELGPSESSESSGSMVDLRLTETGCVMGTPAYMSLEQMRGEPVCALSDQFSFCVALYEAVYGERPFAGRSLQDLHQQLRGGAVRAAPAGHKAPTQLRAILRRGLAPRPEQRWPSMAVLLGQLRSLVKPRRRRWPTVVTLSVGVVLGAVGVTSWVRSDLRCTGSSTALERVWNPTRREQVRQAWDQQEPSPFWLEVESELDHYAQQWIEAHQGICEATRITREQSEAVMDLRMICLGERRQHFEAAVQALARRSAEQDAQSPNKALTLVWELPGLSLCDTVDQLRAQQQRVPPPVDPSTAAAVEEQRERLAQVRSEQTLGRYAHALAQLSPVVERARVLGYGPLQAESILLRGSLSDDDGRYADAERDLLEAHILALEHGDLAVATQAARRLAFVVGVRQDRYAEGAVWAKIAIPLAMYSEVTEERVKSMTTLGSILSDQGHYADAHTWLQRAIELGEAELGAGDPSVLGIVARMGRLLLEQGRYAEAERMYERALDATIEIHGGEHPKVAVALLDMSTVLTQQARHEQAEGMLRRAARIQERLLGPDHPELAMTLDGLAASLMNQGNSEAEAAALFERTYQMYVRAFGSEHRRVAASLYSLARMHSLDGEPERARRRHEQALQIRERVLGPDHPDVARSLNSLGLVIQRQGQCAQARSLFVRALEIQRRALGDEHPSTGLSQNNLASADECEGAYERAAHGYQQALRTWERALGKEHPYVSVALVELATVRLALGEPAVARAHAERAISILEGAQEPPKRLAKARFVLARALWSEPSQRARARRLALAARGEHAHASKVDAWLAEHPVP